MGREERKNSTVILGIEKIVEERKGPRFFNSLHSQSGKSITKL